MSVVRAVRVQAARSTIAAILADFSLLPLYERKVERIIVRGGSARPSASGVPGGPADGKTAGEREPEADRANAPRAEENRRAPPREKVQSSEAGRDVEVRIVGRFGRVPYSGRLRFVARAGGGFDSVLIEGTRLLGFAGSFAVRAAPDGEGCIVTHVEKYRLRGGPLGRAILLLARPWIARSMEEELRRLKRLAEVPALLAAARRGRALDIIAEKQIPVWDPARRRASPRAAPLVRPRVALP